MLDDGPERQRRKEVQRADQQHRPKQQNDERAAGDREGARARRRDFLLRQRSGHRHDRNDHQERPINIARPSVVLYQGVFAVSPAKALPLLPVPELKA